MTGRHGVRVMVLATLGAVACVDSEPAVPDAPVELACTVRDGVLVPPSFRLDLLLVVDRTPSSAAIDARLAAVADQLLQFAGSDVRVAIVTSELGAAVPGCRTELAAPPLPDPRRCGVDGDYLVLGPAGGNYVGPLADVVACLLDVPRSTCAVSQPLGAATAALDGTLPPLREFHRANRADLAVAIITDSDDCSLLRPDALGAIAGDDAAVDAACFARGVICDGDAPREPGDKTGCRPRTDGGLRDPAVTGAGLEARGGIHGTGLAIVAGDAAVRVTVDGDLAPTCAPDAPLGPAVRLRASPGPHVAFSTCTGLESAWWVVNFPFIGHPTYTCAQPNLDRDPAQPGLQAVCAATVGIEVIAACDAASRDPARPCYQFVPNPWCDEGLELEVVNGTELVGPHLAQVECEVTCS